MITVGVDLAAEASRTSLAVLEWLPDRAVLRRLIRPASDETIRAEAAVADKIGVDCPIGWPDAFVELVSAHRERRLDPPADSGRDWRRALTLRTTDLDVQARTGLTPLSVSADRIAHVAMRWAAIAARLEADGIDCARDGSGRVVEVYPSASLKLWGLPFRGYKRQPNLERLGLLADGLERAAPWLDLGVHRPAVRTGDDELDAVVAALTARDAWLAASSGITPDAPPAVATSEGWVHLPGGLDQLAPRPADARAGLT